MAHHRPAGRVGGSSRYLKALRCVCCVCVCVCVCCTRSGTSSRLSVMASHQQAVHDYGGCSTSRLVKWKRVKVTQVLSAVTDRLMFLSDVIHVVLLADRRVLAKGTGILEVSGCPQSHKQHINWNTGQFAHSNPNHTQILIQTRSVAFQANILNAVLSSLAGATLASTTYLATRRPSCAVAAA